MLFIFQKVVNGASATTRITFILDRQTLASSYRLPAHHKDPFARFLVWEAIRSDLVLLSADTASDAYAPVGLKVIH
jgi:PIN domain nuclease of toxin-antitoxin system